MIPLFAQIDFHITLHTHTQILFINNQTSVF